MRKRGWAGSLFLTQGSSIVFIVHEHNNKTKGEMSMKKMIEQFVKVQTMLQDEKGATMVEYALMVALVAVVAAVGATALGGNVGAAFTNISGQIAAAI
jgi:pilus assembly protein Flp/PilA